MFHSKANKVAFLFFGERFFFWVHTEMRLPSMSGNVFIAFFFQEKYIGIFYFQVLRIAYFAAISSTDKESVFLHRFGLEYILSILLLNTSLCDSKPKSDYNVVQCTIKCLFWQNQWKKKCWENPLWKTQRCQHHHFICLK